MICAWVSLRGNSDVVPLLFLETNDDMHLGKLEEVEIHRFCFFGYK